MGNLIRKVKILILSGHTEFSEFFLGLLALLWGIWGVLFGSPTPHDLFENHTLTLLWSFVFLFVGFITCFSTLYNIRTLRRFSTFLNMIVWGTVAVMFFIESFLIIFWATYGLLFVFSIILHIRTKFRGIERYGHSE